MKPFLKWAGNKYPLLERIRPLLPEGRRLIEPFVGAGAVFLNTAYSRNLLADANADLIHLYQTLQREGAAFIGYCEQFFTPAFNTPEAFYRLREEFNASDDPRHRAALFLYFNRHGYNGLCRYNSKGGFNVPFGKYRQPYFPEAELKAFAEQTRRAVFRHQGFEETMLQARPGDVVYCDPPYVPASETANFTSYSPLSFGHTQQQRLAALADELAANGIPVIISNHDTPFTQQAYQSAKIYPFQVQRFISCQGENRAKANEMLALFEAVGA
ncbi:MAG: Dam family site-specific DNA-(adenine-N6)-methyltransferase [Candidatus Melainabacteria bacterium]